MRFEIIGRSGEVLASGLNNIAKYHYDMNSEDFSIYIISDKSKELSLFTGQDAEDFVVSIRLLMVEVIDEIKEMAESIKY